MTDPTAIAKIWNLANILHDDGVIRLHTSNRPSKYIG